MAARLHEISENRVFSQLAARLQAVQPFYENKALAVAPHQDRHLLPYLQNALGDLLRLFRIERGPALGRHVDVRDREFLGLQHGGATWLTPPRRGRAWPGHPRLDRGEDVDARDTSAFPRVFDALLPAHDGDNCGSVQSTND